LKKHRLQEETEQQQQQQQPLVGQYWKAHGSGTG
jgi:hypothetical protein